jgi:hypothetical protein
MVLPELEGTGEAHERGVTARRARGEEGTRSTLFRYKLHGDGRVFEKAYGYIRQYY